MRKGTTGFTIVELLIVIVVIAILAAISIVAYTGIQTRANNTVVVTNLKNTVSALENFNAINGRYPMQTTDYAAVKNDGLVLKATLGNTLLYCVDTANPTSWLLLANGYPSGSYRWTSAGERNSNSGVSIASAHPTCQAQMGGVTTVVGQWAFTFATVQ